MISPDIDGDGVADGANNCPEAPNADQANTDDLWPFPGAGLGDQWGDACDNCPEVPNAGRENAVHSATTPGDHCADPEPDGTFDIADNCPDTVNLGQENNDGDPWGATPATTARRPPRRGLCR